MRSLKHPFLFFLYFSRKYIQIYIILSGVRLWVSYSLADHRQKDVCILFRFILCGYEMNEECGYCKELRLIPSTNAVSQDL